MPRTMEYTTINETIKSPLLKRMRGAKTISRLVLRQRGKSKAGWKSLNDVTLPTTTGSPSTSRSAAHEALKIAEDVLNNSSHTEKTEPSRKVRFDLSSNDVVEPDEEGLTEQEIDNCWWGPSERQACTDAFREEIRAYFRQEDESLENLAKVVKLCNESSNDSYLDDMNAVVAMLPLSSRGMESELIAALRGCRRRHAEAVLEHAAKVPKHLQADLKDRMISARSVQFSRPFKILARVMGEADALALKP